MCESHRFHVLLSLCCESGATALFCGGETGHVMGNRSTAAFRVPTAACLDPLNSTGGYLLADQSSIRYFDVAKNEVTLVAGGPFLGYNRAAADGIGSVNSLLISSDGQTVWCGQTMHGLRRLDRISSTGSGFHVNSVGHTGIENTIFCDSLPSLCWDRTSSSSKAVTHHDSAFFLITLTRTIARFDVSTHRTTEFDALIQRQFSIHSIASTPTGRVLFSTARGEVYSFDPCSSDVELLDGVDAKPTHFALLVIDSTQTLIANGWKKIAAYTLSPNHFPLPKCCERDL